MKVDHNVELLAPPDLMKLLKLLWEQEQMLFMSAVPNSVPGHMHTISHRMNFYRQLIPFIFMAKNYI